MKKISIIIPVYNEAAALLSNLPLLQNFRAAGHELIVVEGGENGDGGARFAHWVDHWVISEAGRAKQMNAGAQLAMGDVLLFLHIDTLLPEEGLAPIEEAFKRLGCVWGRYDVRLSGKRAVFRVIEFMINLRSRVSGVATGDQAIFIRRSLFKQLGGFPDIPLMEDVAISKLLRSKAAPVCLRSKVTTSSRRWEKHGVLRTIFLMWKIRALYFFGVAPSKLHGMYATKDAQKHKA